MLPWAKWDRASALALAWATAACDVPTTTSEVTARRPAVIEDHRATADSDQSERLLNLNDEWARVARTSVPGFAGLYLRGDDEVVVLLTDASRRPEAETYVGAAVDPGERPVARVDVEVVQYDFDQLNEWFKVVASFGDESGQLASLDIDEVNNRLGIRVLSERAALAVRDHALRSGIPSSVVEIRVQSAPGLLHTLRDPYRPSDGGYEIVNVESSEVCTLGWNFTRDDEPHFVTASHCSELTGELDGSKETQPASGAQIGTEVLDATPQSGIYLAGWGVWGCTGTGWYQPCVAADAAAFEYHDSVTTRVGYVARPYGYPGGFGTPGDYLDVNTSAPFRIVAKRVSHNLPVGTSLNKVGRTTGWTAGQVLQTCLHIWLGLNTRCQWLTNVYAESGDSGSPYFFGPIDGDVALTGILWGGHPAGASDTTYMSPIDFVEWHLGEMDVCATEDGSCPFFDYPFDVYISGWNPVPTNAGEMCSWWATPEHNWGQVTYEWEWNGQVVSSNNYYVSDESTPGWYWLEVTAWDGSSSAGDGWWVEVVDDDPSGYCQ
jgi:hypothetical protein